MTMRPTHLRRTAALLLALASVGGGCTGAETETAADPSADQYADGDREGDEEVDDLVWSSPIDEVLGREFEFDEAEHRASQIAVQERTAACMAEEGFTYHQRPPMTLMQGPRFELSRDEFAATYGFGITTGADVDDGAAVEDPNEAMLAEMTQAEQDAWNTALHGAPPPVSEGEDALPWEGGGCEGRASEESSSGDDHDPDVAAAFAPLLNEMASVHEQSQRDPRLAAAAEAYTGCMADAGHPGYSVDGDDPPSASQAVRQRLDAVIDASETAEQEALDQALGGVGELSAVLPADVLAELRAFEIELAVADRPCRDAYERVRFEVMTEHETRWVEANRAELEAYRDAMAESEGER